MKKIPLTKGFSSQVDDLDFELVSKNKWYYSHGYAMRDVVVDGVKTRIYMHRMLCPGKEIDHINSNGLDNRRANLRSVTRSENNWNQRKTRGISTYKGVSWSGSIHRWISRIGYKGEQFHIGSFLSEKDAADAYNREARRRFGNYARLNICK